MVIYGKEKRDIEETENSGNNSKEPSSNKEEVWVKIEEKKRCEVSILATNTIPYLRKIDKFFFLTMSNTQMDKKRRLDKISGYFDKYKKRLREVVADGLASDHFVKKLGRLIEVGNEKTQKVCDEILDLIAIEGEVRLHWILRCTLHKLLLKL